MVTRKAISTSEALDHSVKARVGGLAPTSSTTTASRRRPRSRPSGASGPRFPPTPSEPVKFAFFSCQDYTHGYYNALEAMAGGDYDFVVCLGDYIYDESYHSVADGTGVRDDTIGKAEPG